MWILWVLSIANVNFMRELSIMNVNFIGAEHCECQLYESWALCMWIFKRAELFKSEFYESWALRMWILWELSIVNVNFLRVGLSECHQILKWWEWNKWKMRYKQWVEWNLIGSNKWNKSVMETSREMKWKVKARSESTWWKAMMKGIVDKCIMNEKYNEGKKWNEIWYGSNR